MKKRLLFTTICLFGTFALANPVLEINQKTESSLKESQEKNAFFVSIDENSSKTITTLKEKLENKFSISEVKKNTLKIKSKNIQVNLSNIESDKYSCAYGALNEVFSNDFVSQFKLISIDKEHVFSVSQGEKISGYTFNFMRIFNNRIIRNKNNFLTIRVDSKGALKNAVISLQDLEILDEVATINADYDEYIASLDSTLAADFEFINTADENGFVRKEKVKKIEVNSAIEAYCEIQEGSAKKLFPCVSYASKIELANGVQFNSIIDSPQSRKSWRDYHDQNKTARFVRFSH